MWKMQSKHLAKNILTAHIDNETDNCHLDPKPLLTQTRKNTPLPSAILFFQSMSVRHILKSKTEAPSAGSRHAQALPTEALDSRVPWARPGGLKLDLPANCSPVIFRGLFLMAKYC